MWFSWAYFAFSLCLCKELVALDLTLPLPSVRGILTRWAAEPVSHIFIPASTFIPNAKGYPVLPKGTQQFLQMMMRVRAFSSNVIRPDCSSPIDSAGNRPIRHRLTAPLTRDGRQIRRLHALPREELSLHAPRGRSQHAGELRAGVSGFLTDAASSESRFVCFIQSFGCYEAISVA